MSMSTKAKIEVLQAFDDGLDIQSKFLKNRIDEFWLEAGRPIWNFHEFDYRVKPKKPKKIYLIDYCESNSPGHAYLITDGGPVPIDSPQYIELTDEVRQKLGE